SRRFRDQDPQSRTRGEVLGVEVAVGHAVAQHVVARRNARGWSDVSRRSGRFPGQRPPTTGDRLPRSPPWSAPTPYRPRMSTVARGAAAQRPDYGAYFSDGRRPKRVPSLPTSAVLRTETTDETQGFMKALVAGSDDRILGFAMIGAEAGEVMAVVQTAMLADLPYPKLRDAILAHPTMAEGLGSLFANVPH